MEVPEFLFDRPQNDPKKDKLGHLSIANTLKKVVIKWLDSEEKHSITIGLFGGWGTGKSTITEYLDQAFNKKDAVKVVKFDIWRHKTTSFRRSLLIKLNGQDGLGTDLVKIDELDVTKNESVDGSPYKNLKVWYDLLVFIQILIIFLVVLFAIAGVATYVFGIDYETLDKYIRLIPWAAISSSVLAYYLLSNILLKFIIGFFNRIFNLVKFSQVTVTEHRIQHEDEYEKLFDSIIDEYKKKEKKKVLIIIENLDRVSSDIAIELLAAIKTYLDNENVGFLVECDEDAIIKYLKAIYKYEDAATAEEFLRKFFNTHLSIPAFYPVDIEGYSRSLIEDTGVKFKSDNDLLSVIAQAHTDNPRKVKQFINSFISNYLLAQERENEDPKLLIPGGVVTSNPAMLAKAMVIQRDYKALYKLLVEDPKKWQTISDHFRDGTDLGFELDNSDKELTPKAKYFLQTTSLVTVDEIAPFIFLKTTDDENSVPNARQLLEALGLIEIEKFTDLFEQLKGSEKIGFQRFLADVIRRTSNDSLKISYITGILDFATSKEYDLASDTYSFIYHQFLSGSNQLLTRPEVESLLHLVDSLNANYKKRLLKKYYSLFTTTFDPNQAWELSVDRDVFKGRMARLFAVSLSKEGGSLLNNLQSWLIENSPRALQEFVLVKEFYEANLLNNEIAKKIATDIYIPDLRKKDDEQSLFGFKLMILNNFSQTVSKKIIINRINDIITALIEQKSFEDIRTLLKDLNKLVVEFDVSDMRAVKELTDFNERLAGFHQTAPEDLKPEITDLVVMFAFITLNTEEPLQSQTNNHITTFFNEASEERLLEIRAQLGKELFDRAINSRIDDLRVRSSQNEGFLTFLKKESLLSQEQIEFCAIRKMIDGSSPNESVAVLSEYKKLLDPSAVANAIASRIRKNPNDGAEEISSLIKLLSNLDEIPDNVGGVLASAVNEKVTNPDKQLQAKGVHILDESLRYDLLSDVHINQILQHFGDYFLRYGNAEHFSQTTIRYHLLAQQMKDEDLASKLTKKVSDAYFHGKSEVNLDLLINYIVGAKLMYTKNKDFYATLPGQLQQSPHQFKQQFLDRFEEIKNAKLRLPKEYVEQIESLLAK